MGDERSHPFTSGPVKVEPESSFENIQDVSGALYPALPPADSLINTPQMDRVAATSNGSGRDSPLGRRLPRLPKMNMANVNLPNMMNLNAYMPAVKPPAFLKEVYTLPVQMGDQLNREMQKVGSNINRLIDRSEVYLRTPPPMPEFNNCSILSTLFSIASYIFDVGSDAAVAYVLWDEPDSIWWFWLTVAIIVVPTIFINAFSFYWYWQDDHQCAPKKAVFANSPRMSKCWWITRIIGHVLLIGPLLRHVDILYYGIKSRHSTLQKVNIQGPYCPWPKQRNEFKKQADYYNLLLHEERDVSMLELMHSFMQCAPQLILQLYILARRPPQSKTETDYVITVLVQSTSTVISLLSLSWSLTSYQKALRFAMPDKPNLSVGGGAAYFLWHAFVVAARVVALALFATSYKLEVFILIAAHWGLMFTWILAQRTNFCGVEGKRKPCEELFYNVVMGWVFIFVMLNLKDAPTRIKFSFYYVLMLAENATMIVLWYLYPGSSAYWYHLPALIGTSVAFSLGIFFMILYYRKYHPDGRMPQKGKPARLF